jgi:hypothetical protein
LPIVQKWSRVCAGSIDSLATLEVIGSESITLCLGMTDEQPSSQSCGNDAVSVQEVLWLRQLAAGFLFQGSA